MVRGRGACVVEVDAGNLKQASKAGLCACTRMCVCVCVMVCALGLCCNARVPVGTGIQMGVYA